MWKGYTWRRCRKQAYDMWEKKIVDGKGDGAEEGGWPTQSKLTCAER